MSSFGYDPDADPVLIAYQTAMENEDYSTALRIAADLNQEAVTSAAEGAYQVGLEQGFAQAAAQAPPRSPEEQAEVDRRYAAFLGQPPAEPELTPQQKAAKAIVDTHHSSNYEFLLKKAFEK
jgi:hypothetical protein